MTTRTFDEYSWRQALAKERADTIAAVVAWLEREVKTFGPAYMDERATVLYLLNQLRTDPQVLDQPTAQEEPK